MVQHSSLPAMESNDVDDEAITEKQRLVPHDDDNQGISFD